MSTSLDNQQTTNITKEMRLFDEIRHILIRLPHGKKADTPVVVYLPREGPVAYSFEGELTPIKGVFKGDYNSQTVKNVVNMVRRGEYSHVRVSPKGLYSYNFWLEEVV